MILNITAPDGFDTLTNEFLVTAPDGFDPLANEFLVAAPLIGIDPAKVLLIVNSDVALSGQAADYYVTARGLGANRITVSLGTDDTTVGGADGATPATFYTNVVVPVANLIDAQGIEAVICSAAVPPLVNCIPDPTALLISTASVLGAARFIRDTEGGMVRALSTLVVEPQIQTQSANGWFYEPFTFTYGSSQTTLGNNNFLDFRSQGSVIPYGRLGLPKFTALHPAETLTEVQRMIDQAVAAEGQGAALGAVHFGLHDRSLPYITGYQTEIARQEASAFGLTIKHFIRTYTTDWPDTPPAADYTYADANAGTLNEDCAGLLESAFGNQDLSANWTNSYNFLAGSWGYGATSGGADFMGNVITNGGCAAIGTIQEPQNDGVAETHSFFRGLIGGRAMCEAMYFGRLKHPWMHECCGDPLYAPYKRG